MLAALRGEILVAAPGPADPPAHSDPDIPVETVGAAQPLETATRVDDLPPLGEATIRPAKSSLQAIAIDNAEVALALAAHEQALPDAVEIDEETAQYVALTEKNEEIARWLFAREGLERDVDVRRLAARALKNCPRESVAAALLETLADTDQKLRIEAASALAEIAAQPAVRTVLAQSNRQLMTLAGGEDRNARLLAIRIRARAGMDAGEVELQALEDTEVTVRNEALRALAVCHQAGPAGVSGEVLARRFKTVSACLSDPAPDVRLAAAQAAIRIAAQSATPLIPAQDLATLIIDAVFAGGGERAREFARGLRAWDLETAGTACLARLESLTHSTERRFAIELLEELYADTGGGIPATAPIPSNH